MHSDLGAPEAGRLVYFDNDQKAAAPQDAKRLTRIVSG
jgi:hypothetical protein